MSFFCLIPSSLLGRQIHSCKEKKLSRTVFKPYGAKHEGPPLPKAHAAKQEKESERPFY